MNMLAYHRQMCNILYLHKNHRMNKSISEKALSVLHQYLQISRICTYFASLYIDPNFSHNTAYMEEIKELKKKVSTH